MLKDSTYKEKCIMLKSWMPQIIETVKKDLKNEHLKSDFKFLKKYFAGKNINKLTTQDFVEAYSTALEQEENGEELAEFVTNRWLTKNTELYEYFEKALSQISADFTELTEIEAKKSQEIVDGAVQHYGAPRTYLFSVMNSVVFPREVYEKLDQRAKEAQKKTEQEESTQLKHLSIENMKKHYEEQIGRLTDKYEKKISGWERKYLLETEALKKQIAALQKRLNAGQ